MRTSVKSAEALKNNKSCAIVYKQLTRSCLLRGHLSEQPITYLIRISGSGLNEKAVDMSRIYDERHPLMAVGRAVAEFYRDFLCGKIHDIIVKQRIIK